MADHKLIEGPDVAGSGGQIAGRHIDVEHPNFLLAETQFRACCARMRQCPNHSAQPRQCSRRRGESTFVGHALRTGTPLRISETRYASDSVVSGSSAALLLDSVFVHLWQAALVPIRPGICNHIPANKVIWPFCSVESEDV